VLLNAVLLTVAGASVYFLLQWRAGRLPAKEQTILRNEILVARAALKPTPPDIEAAVQRAFEDRVRQSQVPPAEQLALRAQLRQMAEAAYQAVPPRGAKDWLIDLGLRRLALRDQPLFVRVKFYAARTNATGTYLGQWQIGPPDRLWVQNLSLAADAFHEFAIPPNLFDAQGRLFIRMINLENTTLVVPLEDGFEVLHREGGFALNFVRGLLIILCWLALLAAIGLAAATFLSFPVAAFLSASILCVVLSSGTLANVVAEGTVMGVDHEGGAGGGRWIDAVLLPFFRAMLAVVNVAKDFSPIDALSTGRSITWLQLVRAVAQIVLLLGGIAAAIGMTVLTRRELATAQSNI
jgi:hypothetical protein